MTATRVRNVLKALGCDVERESTHSGCVTLHLAAPHADVAINVHADGRAQVVGESVWAGWLGVALHALAWCTS